ncbi:acyl-CoA dehydratase activase-related protein [Melissococcus plutonius]|uniref:acyl-CoA dehydratase activase-related protein n=1 Tax=Melissococcus plutonius TaxID=33970 RepID=UPI003C2F6A8B
MVLKVGIDVGSTTVKMVILNEKNTLIFSNYERHYSDIKEATKKVLQQGMTYIGKKVPIKIAITGSGGIGLADVLHIPFVQEVIACTKTIEELISETDVAIELGGEDAKITFFDGALDQRMNGSCAGGTDAFIDQMATLLKTDAHGLNELAKDYQTIYPIASRCGVFAKTDVQPLLNEGAEKADIAASILQAVVNQTITGLASGRKIHGKIAFLGGPLSFMSELRKRFIETLAIQPYNIIFPDNSQLFVAIGAAMYADEEVEETFLEKMMAILMQDNLTQLKASETLAPLFNDQEELEAFRKRHNQAIINHKCFSDHHVVTFLGIDAGSTTMKVTLIDEEGNLLFTFYGNNDGQPLEKARTVLEDLYKQMPQDVFIGKAAITGYGEGLIKNALKVDIGEVETVAHYKAADYFQPGVDFILDIGGQDMKAMTIKNGILSSIQLNEACSSGCGSFIETFAESLNYNVKDFALKALTSKAPADLGSRCTVFMNSKVKQVQKEGAKVADISAGLSYSVIKNAMYKVIKVRNAKDLGTKIVCQGGTFYNESVLRAFELISGREVIRPPIAGLMGAYGAALIALEEYELGDVTTLLPLDQLQAFKTKKEFTHCGLCENNCLLTMTIFSDGRQFITRNRCERGAKIKIKKTDRRINLVDYKYRKLFNYHPLKEQEATRGKIGLPRALNLFENYPLWFTFFTELGFRVELSQRSSKELYENGIETIPSDTICYPAKITHGHIQDLIHSGINRIFYPGVIFEREEGKTDNHYNCPIVQSYPDVIKNNIDEIRFGQVDYYDPYINLGNEESVVKVLTETFKDLGITQAEIATALHHGYEELESFKADIRKKGEDTLLKMNQNGEKGIVLAGRPYHLDPEINHGIAEMIIQEGFHVLTEDSIAHLGDVEKLRVVNQWIYHSRLYAAANVVAKMKNLELVQLNSFGCGIDAVTTDQVEEIMAKQGKIYTVLKIDEGSNLGAIRIRLRSLKASIKEREKYHIEPVIEEKNQPNRIIFTKKMKNNYTLLMPMLSPIHQSGLVDLALNVSGYNVICLPAENKNSVNVGFQYVNNDACYPAIISIGQIIEALKSGDYDLNYIGVMMTQTGGGCRATNYIPLLRKALNDAGFSQVPIISISMGNKGVEKNAGFKFTLPLIKRVAIAFLYGDLFERMVYRTRPYEAIKGSVDALHQTWLKKVEKNVRNGSLTQFNRNAQNIINDFDKIELRNIQKPRVGIVGEILVKYSPIANNNIVRLLEKEGAEVIVPDIIGFMNYSLYNQIFKYQNLGMTKKSKNIAQLMLRIIHLIEKPMDKALRASKRFEGIHSINELAEDASKIVSIGNHTGEGWFLTGEMIELLKMDITNIICLQPFGCLPNHIVGKGVLKELKRQYPKANVTAIDYDPGTSIVNQLNRIRLMMATANKMMKKKETSEISMKELNANTSTYELENEIK